MDGFRVGKVEGAGYTFLVPLFFASGCGGHLFYFCAVNELVPLVF